MRLVEKNLPHGALADGTTGGALGEDSSASVSALGTAEGLAGLVRPRAEGLGRGAGGLLAPTRPPAPSFLDLSTLSSASGTDSDTTKQLATRTRADDLERLVRFLLRCLKLLANLVLILVRFLLLMAARAAVFAGRGTGAALADAVPSTNEATNVVARAPQLSFEQILRFVGRFFDFGFYFVTCSVWFFDGVAEMVARRHAAAAEAARLAFEQDKERRRTARAESDRLAAEWKANPGSWERDIRAKIAERKAGGSALGLKEGVRLRRAAYDGVLTELRRAADEAVDAIARAVKDAARAVKDDPSGSGSISVAGLLTDQPQLPLQLKEKFGRLVRAGSRPEGPITFELVPELGGKVWTKVEWWKFLGFHEERGALSNLEATKRAYKTLTLVYRLQISSCIHVGPLVPDVVVLDNRCERVARHYNCAS